MLTMRVAAPLIAEVRRFNRFYTREIGVLSESFLKAGLSLPEARVLYEIKQGNGSTAKEIGRQLRMDAGYLSRVLLRLVQRRLVARQRSANDARQSMLTLTKRGEQQFELQNNRQSEEVAKLLRRLTSADQLQLVESMRTVQRLLGGEEPKGGGQAFILRMPRLGDMGWVLLKHGEGYADRYGWDERFEAIVARVVADFEIEHDPKRERCWIAERERERVGCVFLVRHPEQKDVAKLRLLWVDPTARGMGLGKTLVQECTKFASHAGYKKIVLWTNSELKAARRIYEHEGYKLIKREPHPVFAKGQFGEEWELAL